MLDPSERADSPGDGLGLGASKTRRRHGRERIFHVVLACERNVLEMQHRFLLAVPAKHNFVSAHERTLSHALLPAKPVHLRFGGRVRRGRWIIRVQDRAVGFRLILEDAGFGSAIRFERVMPVQMVRGEIQEHADVGAKRFNQFQLKTA